jgi:hypothetical protein
LNKTKFFHELRNFFRISRFNCTQTFFGQHVAGTVPASYKALPNDKNLLFDPWLAYGPKPATGRSTLQLTLRTSRCESSPPPASVPMRPPPGRAPFLT